LIVSSVQPNSVKEQIYQVRDTRFSAVGLLDSKRDRRDNAQQIVQGQILANRSRFLRTLEQPQTLIAPRFAAGSAAFKYRAQRCS